MPRRPGADGVDSADELARKLEVLEREMAAQRDAMEQLKRLGRPAGRETASASRTGNARRASAGDAREPDHATTAPDEPVV